jgi:hypothetical protein
MKSKEEIEKRLEDFGKAWPVKVSVVNGVLREIETMPVRPKLSNRRRIAVKSFFGMAVCIAVVALIWWGVLGERNSLYAQVVEAVHKSRTFHTIQYEQLKDVAKAVKMERWFERGVGFRVEDPHSLRVGNERYVWSLNRDQNLVIRSKSSGIDQALDQFFTEIDKQAHELQTDYQRYPDADEKFDGQTLQAYLLTRFERYPDPSIKSGRIRILVFLDEQSRLVKTAVQDTRYHLTIVTNNRYDEPVDPAIFKPNFGKDVRIIDADKAFDEFVDLHGAVYVEERSGIIYAIHHLERFENRGLFVVSSVRPTEDTQKKFGKRYLAVSTGSMAGVGPAENQHGVFMGLDNWHIDLAHAEHHDIDLLWWAIIPRGTRPNFFEVKPGRIKLPVGVMPCGDFADLFKDKNGVIHPLSWNVELDVPMPKVVPTLEEIANRVYADQVSLDAVDDRTLSYGDKHEQKATRVEKVTSSEYAKMVADQFRSCLEVDVDFQLDDLFDPVTRRPKHSMYATEGRVPIALSYYPIVNDATLERVAERPMATELYLRGTRITDDGLQHLSGLRRLQILDLGGTGITDAGLQHLRELVELRHLNLADTKVTAEGVEMLKKALPNVEIDLKLTGKTYFRNM